MSRSISRTPLFARFLARFLAPLLGAWVASSLAGPHDASATHCRDDEVTYFSCPVQGASKVVSLCGGPRTVGSADPPASPDWLQYRYGPLGHPELVYPKTRPDSVSRFEGEFRRGLGVLLDAVSFSNAGVRYVVESSSSTQTGEAFDGVRVQPGGRRPPVSLPCAARPTGEEDFSRLADELDPTPK